MIKRVQLVLTMYFIFTDLILWIYSKLNLLFQMPLKLSNNYCSVELLTRMKRKSDWCRPSSINQLNFFFYFKETHNFLSPLFACCITFSGRISIKIYHFEHYSQSRKIKYWKTWIRFIYIKGKLKKNIMLNICCNLLPYKNAFKWCFLIKRNIISCKNGYNFCYRRN